MWLPWALPTLSKESVDKAIALGLLLWCTQQKDAFFDRKSYFYPDLPMGYQITQYTRPININGLAHYRTNDYSEEKTVHITQAHLECDTAKTTAYEWNILLDYNRAGTPLVEIVTAPDFHDAEEIAAFLKEMQRTLQYYTISDAQMDKGQMRCDVNISVSKNESLGTKVEIKNMNSISAIKRAIQFEYTRQTTLLDAGKELQQETRWWDDAKWESFSLRSKENALDYRYFPEPDLPPLAYTDEDILRIKNTLWETMATKIARYKNEYGFHKEYTNGILSDKSVTHLFEECIDAGFAPQTIAKYIVNYVLATVPVWALDLTHTSFSTESFLAFLAFITQHKTRDQIAKQIITTYLTTREPMDSLCARLWDSDTDEDTLDPIIQDVLSGNPDVVDEYKKGKTTTIWFLIGQVMKKTWGKSDPQVIQAKLKSLLD